MAAPITRGDLKVAAAKSLSAYFQATLDTATVGPHTTLSVPKIGDVAFDAERFEFWYVSRNNPAAINLVSASAANPTLVTVASAHFLQPGDEVTFANVDATLNGKKVVLTTPSATTFTVVSAAGYAGIGAVGTMVVSGQYRVITSTGLPAATTITLTRAFSSLTALPAGTLLDFWLILNPDELNECVNTGLQDKFFKDRLAWLLVDGVYEYDLTDITKSYYAPWVQSKGQFIRGRYRDTTISGAPVEYEIPVIYFEEVAYGVKVVLPKMSLPSNLVNIQAVLELRHYYDKLTADTDTTTLPERLAVLSVKNEMLKKIFQKLGIGAKRIYGMQMALTEKELAEQESRWLDNSARRDLNDEDFPIGGDPERGIQWGW